MAFDTLSKSNSYSAKAMIGVIVSREHMLTSLVLSGLLGLSKEKSFMSKLGRSCDLPVIGLVGACWK